MESSPTGRLASLFYTGTTPFLVANPNFVYALINASRKCEIHALEDIYDANGLLLWTSGKAIDERLLERLVERQLRKPIELCVYASDPASRAALRQEVEEIILESADIAACVGDSVERIHNACRSFVPNPTELMLMSVMRFGTEGRIRHAVRVAVLTLAAAHRLNLPEKFDDALLRAALFHDIGELYLDDHLFDPTRLHHIDDVKLIRNHPALGAQVILELARSGKSVAHLVAASHERLDGWGYPAGALAADLSAPARCLLFAEAIAGLFERNTNRLRRAAISVRIIPSEFDPLLVNWISQTARTQAVEPVPPEMIEHTARNLALSFDILKQMAQRLNHLDRETNAAKHASAAWTLRVKLLLQVLSATGVSESLADGLALDSDNPQEQIELHVLAQELRHRLRLFRLRLEIARHENTAIDESPTVQHLIETLLAGESDPTV